MNKQILEKIIEKKICADEKIGFCNSASGHISEIDFSIDNILIVGANENCYVVEYCYSIIVTSEFTMMPDMPPYTYSYKNIISINKDGKIIKSNTKQRIK